MQVTFDPTQVSYGSLLQIYFSVAHNPTELNRQGPDSGTQYRSALFPVNADQQKVAQAYIAQLIDKGYHVAICDQTEDPKAAKGLVKRAVTRVITPGTVLEDANLASKSHNFLGALCPSASGGAGGLACGVAVRVARI